MAIKEIKDFIHDNYYRQIQFPKENSYYSMKNQKKKIFWLNCTNSKQNCQSYLKRKKNKTYKAIKNNNQK